MRRLRECHCKVHGGPFMAEISPGPRPSICPGCAQIRRAQIDRDYKERNRELVRERNRRYAAEVKAGVRKPRKYTGAGYKNTALLTDHASTMKPGHVHTFSKLMHMPTHDFARTVDAILAGKDGVTG